MKRLLALVTMLCLTVAPSWAAASYFVPDGPGGPSTLSATWESGTHAFTIQGYYGQGWAPASWIVDTLPIYEDLNAWFSLSATLHMDGTVEPGGSVSLYGFSESAGVHDPTVLFIGTLAATSVLPDGGAWSLPCTVDTLAEPFRTQAWNPSACGVGLNMPEHWDWDPSHLSGQPVITFEGTHNPVPEPGTWVLMLTGVAAMIGYGAWRRRSI